MADNKRKADAAAAEAPANVFAQGPLPFIPPVIAVLAHVAFLADGYNRMVGAPDPLGSGMPWTQPAALVAAYLAIISALWVTRGSRPQLDVSAAMLVYNVYETALSFFMLVVLVTGVYRSGYDPLDFTMLPNRTARGSLLAWGLWVNYHSKFLEYFDTFFMLLRNKESSLKQVSALHVIHHAVMGPVMWTIFTLCPGGNSYFGPAINSFIHTVMYAYYLAAQLGYRSPLKKYLTIMQLVQFVFILVHASFHLWVNIAAYKPGPAAAPLDLLFGTDVYYPSALAYIQLGLMILMLSMFSDFFVKSYSKPQSKPKAA